MEKQNRLAAEKSPYLLQHANNPVDWFPWGEEAFSKAAEEEKPVFLSIGYSTCHWCHVMEKESFEDNEIAGLMNDAFISIKVDREERPDIDFIYMTVCQMLTGAGGWPLTIILTPDKKPFFAGTYFPKENRFGKVGIKELIPRIKELWKTNRQEINNSAGEIYSALQNYAKIEPGSKLTEDILDEAYKDLEKRFDPQFGGFADAPKFPTPHNLLFLLRYFKRRSQPKALEMAEKTLREMRKGGIFDQIGFGFHRYSTDREWLVPHFEKMLYDQALIAEACIEAYQLTKKDIYKKITEEIFEYVLRDMTSPDGGFYSAEDADSEGEEGKFYLWKYDQLKEILNGNAELILQIFNVKPQGNWFDPVHGGYNGTNILRLQKGLDELAKESGLSADILIKKINSAREKIFQHRKQRVHPFKDDKILTDWNSLMISAFAKASAAFNNAYYLNAGENAASFIFNNLFDSKGLLLHRYRQDNSAIIANADDYAFFIASLIDLYEASFNTYYLKKALELTKQMLEHYWDNVYGGFFFTPDFAMEQQIVRNKEVYDGAVPSGNSVALLNLLKLGRITADPQLEEKA
ncbi:MAG TPA: thioredoxin domain-containing protein, partial [Ignavibacteriaceae bacterium]|nr:thioredoxin domain-containing protein [Ignavibacteriaceae bacterium]